MYFKRKVYAQLLEWKEKYADKYAVLLEGARQAIKHLVKDGRYHYIETGSLISIKKNVKNILIPSEEMKIQVYPMDYGMQEFCATTGNSYSLLEKIYEMKKGLDSR